MVDLWASRQFPSLDDFYLFCADRYGPERNTWPFVCPACSTVSTGLDFIAIGQDPEQAAQECIGRHLPQVDDKPVRGCDWSAYGLFSGPWFVHTGTTEMGVFPLKLADDDPAIGVEDEGE